MPKKPAVKQAIGDGLRFIASQQRADGSFESFSSPLEQPFQPEITYRTSFVPSLILSSLASISTPESMAIRDRLAAWLGSQASPHWSFNYWATDAPEYRQQPYPDDLDDTFCALSALYLHDPELIDGQALAGSIKLLLATESAIGGPYRTWLVPPSAEPVWRDIDLAVNSNIAYFLSLSSNPLPKLTEIMEQAITSDKLASPYYPSAYPIAYYIARAYRGDQQTTLVKILRRLLTGAGNPLETALCLASLARLGITDRESEKAFSQLLAQRTAEGSWPAAAFCLDPAIDNQTYYNGSAALTTAFAIEALALYSRAENMPETGRPSESASHSGKINRQQKVLTLATRQCEPLTDDLRKTTLIALRKLAGSRNGPEIIELAERFNSSLAQPVRNEIDNLLSTLGLANLYGWLAYTVYDDFMDEEGQPRLLPVANVTMRNSFDCYRRALPTRRSFSDLVQQTFDTIDGANSWELTHCRFIVPGNTIVIGKLPDYQDLSQLAERSLGHTLTPLALLSAQGLQPNDAAFRQVVTALRHYLIVRQLNDDVHDWQADLAKGHINYVVARILSELNIKPGSRRLSSLLNQAQRQFWRHTLPSISEEMQRHITLSRQALTVSQLFIDNDTVSRLLDGFEVSLAETLATQRQTVHFLKYYRQAPVS